MARHDDPLALPAVPPPAPPGHPWRDAIVVGVFVAALVVAGTGAWRARESVALDYEQRRAEPWPAWGAATSVRGATAAFDRAFGDRFGGRRQLVLAHHAIKAVGFGVSPVSKVMLGRDGWLYFLGEDGQALDRDFRGTPPLPGRTLDAAVAAFAERAAFLASEGIAYLVVVVPDKATIYPEHLPSWVRRAEATSLDRLTAAIRRDGRVRFVDLRGPLAAAKAREPVFHRTDSHWNLAGAAVGYAELLAAAQHALPRYRNALLPAARLPEPQAGASPGGDLAAMLGLQNRFHEHDARPLAALLADASLCARRIDAHVNAPGRETYACDRPGLPTLMMLRDSMAIPLVPLLAEHFSRSLYLSRRDLDPALVLAERPDLVIDELVERNIVHAAAHAPGAPPLRR